MSPVVRAEVGVDRLDLKLAMQEACRGMAAPGEADLRKIQRIARYIQAVSKVVITTRSRTRGSM